jgi:uncharacterized protein
MIWEAGGKINPIVTETMSNKRNSQLRFNFGFLLEANYGTSREIELDYPQAHISEDLTLAPLQGAFTATRTSRGIYLAGELHSNASIECVRCLETAMLPIVMHLDELFYYPPSEASPGELAVGEDGYIDLGPLLRDLSLLEIPVQSFCRPDCRGLCPECGQNLNEALCQCDPGEPDERLAILRKLLDTQES